MIEVSEEFLASVLGTSQGEITEALKDGEEFKSQAEIEGFVKSKIDELVYQAKKKGHTEGHGRGFKESLTAKERELKEKYGVDGKDIDEIFESAVEAAKTTSQSNPEDVKNSEVYINDTKKLKQIIEEKDNEIVSIKKGFERTETFRGARQYGEKLLKDQNFVLPDDDDIANNLIATIFEKLEDDNTKIATVDGKLVVLDANGKPKENEAGTKDITFDDHLISTAKRYLKVAVADDRKSPGNKKKEGEREDDPTDFPEIKSNADFMRELNALKGKPEEMLKLKDHYQKLVEDGKISD